DAGPEGGLGDRDLGLVVQLGALAGQRRVGLDMDGDVEAAGRSAARPDLAFVGEADLVALGRAGRGRDPEPPRRPAARAAVARVARRLDDLALAPAARAGADVDHLAEHRLADGPDLAAAVALRAGDRLRAGLRAAPLARLAALEDVELDLLLGALDRLLE